MRTRSWIVLLLALALVLGGLLLWQQFGTSHARYAEILLDGVLVKTVDLSETQRFTVEGPSGYNVIAVEQGRIRVAEADCRGKDCVKLGAKNSGSPIVCLPHRLVIRFTDNAGIDGLSG